MKYLVRTQGKDFITNKRSSYSLRKEMPSQDFEVFGKDGMLIYFYDNKRKKECNICDGLPRQWAIDFIKNHKVGDFTEDVEGEWANKYYNEEVKVKIGDEIHCGSRREIIEKFPINSMPYEVFANYGMTYWDTEWSLWRDGHQTFYIKQTEWDNSLERFPIERINI